MQGNNREGSIFGAKQPVARQCFRGALGSWLIVLALLATLFSSGCMAEREQIQISEQEVVQVQTEGQTQTQIQIQIQTREPVINQSGNNQSFHAVPILYYHSIGYEEGNELRIPPEEFEAHMQFLYDKGYNSITLGELYQFFYEGGVLPDLPFVLTFDDGYEDNYTNAFPIAQKYGFQGTVFMVTDWIGGAGYLKPEQLLEMVQAGWQIESHTVTHPFLNGISTEEIVEQLLYSKKELEKLHGKNSIAIAYPYGVYNPEIIEACKEAGYIIGLTTERGWAVANDPFRIQRIYCYAHMGVGELKRRIQDPNY